jgi:hypothetical protein
MNRIQFVETFIRREDAGRFIEEVRGGDPDLASCLRRGAGAGGGWAELAGGRDRHSHPYPSPSPSRRCALELGAERNLHVGGGEVQPIVGLAARCPVWLIPSVHRVVHRPYFPGIRDTPDTLVNRARIPCVSERKPCFQGFAVLPTCDALRPIRDSNTRGRTPTRQADG